MKPTQLQSSDSDFTFAPHELQPLWRQAAYRDAAASVEIRGHQPETDVIHKPLRGRGVFGRNEVHVGRQQLDGDRHTQQKPKRSMCLCRRLKKVLIQTNHVTEIDYMMTHR